MFPQRYFPGKHFAPHYFSKTGHTLIILYGVTALLSDIRELGALTDAREAGALSEAARELGAIT